MTKDDYERFTKMMDGLASIYNRELSPVALQMHFNALKGLSIEELERNAEIHLKTNKFFPMPVDLLNTVNEEDIAILACEVAFKAIGWCGYYKSLEFEDKVIHSVIEAMGGWMEFSVIELNDWTRKEFCKLYRVFAKRGNHPEYLVGFHELGNKNRSFYEFIKEPIQIPCEYLPERKKLEAPKEIKKLNA